MELYVGSGGNYFEPIDNNIINFIFEFPCVISLYYIKNKQDAALAI